MSDFGEAFVAALRLMSDADPAFVSTVALSMQVSGSATLVATAIGMPLGAALAIARFPGRAAAVAVLNASLGVPSVVVGLVVYLLLSRSGPLGDWGLLFTPSAMVIAQTILVTPMAAALARQLLEHAWEEFREPFASLRLNLRCSVRALLWDCRFGLTTTLLAVFGRAIAEVGAVMTVGGNIAGATRVMTTSIALETSKGDLALALGLGIVLAALVLLVTGIAQAVRHVAAQRHGE
jgi:tungstate transport system permease protein